MCIYTSRSQTDLKQNRLKPRWSNTTRLWLLGQETLKVKSAVIWFWPRTSTKPTEPDVHLAQDLQSAHHWQGDGALLEAITGLGAFLQKEQLLAMAGRRYSPAASLCTPKGQKVWSLASVHRNALHGSLWTQHYEKSPPPSFCGTPVKAHACGNSWK